MSMIDEITIWFSELSKWKVFECTEISCDLSNWFAELIFGILIGGGIFFWQFFSHRNRSSIFAQQIFDEVIPMTLDISRLINSIKYDYGGKTLKTERFSDSENHDVITSYAEIQKSRKRLQERLDASGMSLSANMQNETQILIDKLCNDLQRPTDRDGMIEALNKILQQCLEICKESNVSKKDIKKRIKNIDKWIGQKKEKLTEKNNFAQGYIDIYEKTKKDLKEIQELIETHGEKSVKKRVRLTIHLRKKK